ncbi:MAG: hypothetical protein V7646_4183 [Pseudonocardia sp.]
MNRDRGGRYRHADQPQPVAPPTLLLQGAADRLVPLSTARELGSAAPDRGWDVRYVEFPGPSRPSVERRFGTGTTRPCSDPWATTGSRPGILASSGHGLISRPSNEPPSHRRIRLSCASTTIFPRLSVHCLAAMCGGGGGAAGAAQAAELIRPTVNIAAATGAATRITVRVARIGVSFRSRYVIQDVTVVYVNPVR